MLDGTDACPMGSLRQNDFPFKLGARARGTGMDNARGSGFAGEGGNDVAVANAGSRFYGEIDEAMVFNIGIDADQAASIYNLFGDDGGALDCDSPSSLITSLNEAASASRTFTYLEKGCVNGANIQLWGPTAGTAEVSVSGFKCFVLCALPS